jgi:hypothetical protein
VTEGAIGVNGCKYRGEHHNGKEADSLVHSQSFLYLSLSSAKRKYDSAASPAASRTSAPQLHPLAPIPSGAFTLRYRRRTYILRRVILLKCGNAGTMNKQPLPFAQKCLAIGCGFLYLFLSLHIMVVFLVGSNLGWDNTPFGKPPSVPIAHRVLVPTVIASVKAAIPNSLKQSVTPRLIALRDSPAGKDVLRGHYDLSSLPLPLADENIFDLFIKMAVVYVTLIAFLVMLFILTRALLPESLAYAAIAPLLAMLVINTFARKFAYTYDFTELFFSCACFYLLFKQRWRPYLLCVALATLNKETVIFSIIFYWIWFGRRLPLKQYLRLGVLQSVIFGAIKIGLVIYFHAREAMYAGGSYQNTLLDNLRFIHRYGHQEFLWLTIISILVFCRWPEKPRFLRGGLWMIGANLGAYLLTCNPGEYRDLYWGLPVVIVLASHSVVRLGRFIAYMP